MKNSVITRNVKLLSFFDYNNLMYRLRGSLSNVSCDFLRLVNYIVIIKSCVLRTIFPRLIMLITLSAKPKTLRRVTYFIMENTVGGASNTSVINSGKRGRAATSPYRYEGNGGNRRKTLVLATWLRTDSSISF